jgi:hypothetical protein
MTFDEWVERSIPMTDQEKTFAWFAWKAATEAEREACAEVCESFIGEQPRAGFHGEYKQGAKNCAAAIRMRSNAELTGRCRRSGSAPG